MTAKRKFTDRELEILNELDRMDKENPGLANRIYILKSELPDSWIQTKVVMHVALGIAIGAVPMVIADAGGLDWKILVRFGVLLFMAALLIGGTAWLFSGDNYDTKVNHSNTHTKLNLYAIKEAARADAWQGSVIGANSVWSHEDFLNIKKMADLWLEFYRGKDMPNEKVWLYWLAKNLEQRKLFERLDQLRSDTSCSVLNFRD